MDYDVCITKIDGALLSLSRQGYLNSSKNLSDVVNVFQDIIQNFKEDEKRKAVFFMILNTDLLVLDLIQDDENLGFFIKTPAFLKNNFFIDYVYELNLQDHLNSAITNCPTAVTEELIECLIEKLKKPEFHKDKYGVKYLYDLWEAVFEKIWKVESENGTEKTQNFFVFFEELFDLIKKCLTTSMNIRRDDLVEFTSKHLYYFFNSIKTFVGLYTNQSKPSKGDDFYNFTVNFNNSKQNIKNSSKECFEVIFNNLQDILNCLTFDIWMSLLEVDIEFKSAQEAVGNCIYDICEAHEVINIPSNILTCLSALKIKPKTELDEIEEADLKEIIQKVDEGKKAWFEALIKHDEFCSKDSLECVLRNLILATEEDVQVILGTLLKHIPSDNDLIQELFFSTLKLLPEDKYVIWTDEIFDVCQLNSLQNSKTKDEIIEIFNKFSREEDVKIPDLICLFIQFPHEVITKICTIGVDNAKQIDLSIQLLKHLSKHAPKFFYSTTENQTLLSFVMFQIIDSDLNDRQQEAVIEFVLNLSKEKLPDDTFFITLFQVIKDCLQNEKIEKAVLYLRILELIVEEDVFLYNRPAVLVFLSQVLGHLSWDLKTFSMVKADGVDVIERIVVAVIRKLQNDDVELEWTRREILKSWEVNQAIFCDIWFRFDRKWFGSKKLHSYILALAHSNYVDCFLEALHGLEDPSDLRPSIILALFVVLPVLSFPNWKQIFDRLRCEKLGFKEPLDVLDMFGSALYFLTLNLQTDADIFLCYKFCLRNFSRLVKQTIPELNSEGLFKTIERLMFLLNFITSQKTLEDCVVILSPVIFDLIDQLKKTDGLVEFREKIEGVFRIFDEKCTENAMKFSEKFKF